MLTSEEIEMQKVEQEKARAKRLSMRNKKTMERALQGDYIQRGAKAPAKKQLTKASSPKLSTSQRPKAAHKRSAHFRSRGTRPMA